MKVVLLHYAAPPVVGGVESVINHHARLMVEAGHEVSIVAGRGEQIDSPITFIHLPLADSRHPEILAVKSELDSGRLPEDFNPLVDRIAAELGVVTSNADWIIAHNVCSLNKNLPLTAALKQLSDEARISRLILWHHDLAWTTPRYRGELHDGYPWDLLRQDWPSAIQVTISKTRQKELAGLLRVPTERIHCIPNGLDIAQFLRLDDQTQAFVKQLELTQASPLLLLPVRITPRKNIEMALRVLACLHSDFPRSILLVTGPLGPHNPANVEYFARLRVLRDELGLSGSAYFLAELSEEYLPDTVIADLYQLADGLFLPSREEGFGIPLLEAGLVGIPIFCADIPPLRELGDPYITFFSLESDPADIAREIATYYDAAPIFKFRQRVRWTYSWQRIYNQLIEPMLQNGW